MEVIVSNVELRNRVVWTKERKYVKRDGTDGTIASRPYFTVDSKNKDGVMVSNMIYLSDDKKSMLESKIKDFPDHAKLNLVCDLESTFDGQFRVVAKEVNLVK